MLKSVDITFVLFCFILFMFNLWKAVLFCNSFQSFLAGFFEENFSL